MAVVINLYSRQAVGWAINKHMKASLAKGALAVTHFRRRVGKGLRHHSDRVGQDAVHESQDQLKQSGMTCSLSRKGD